MSAAYAIQVPMCLCGHPKGSHTLGVLCEDCECPGGYEERCPSCGASDPRLCQCPESSECPYCGVEGPCEHAIKGDSR